MDYPVGERGVLGLPVMWRSNLPVESRAQPGTRIQAARRTAWRQSLLRRHRHAGGSDRGKPQAYICLDTGSSHSAHGPYSRAISSAPAGGEEGLSRANRAFGLWERGCRDYARVADEGGEHPIVLRPAPVLLTTTGGASNWHYGTIGIDLLNQTQEVTLDFKTMTYS